ncbi:putative metal-dependent hydrolase [Paenibacillus psychroresistens]|uniref:Putative metal-dependent hydrolase n=1 Tax=Paenibacillus psychroresistens TaxID=1778678 RepID=A0A6B8RLS2_9BACL|nr:putative metal-dependent hydrolase [Paenibacillus psychroresistens]QGQ96493.1 putative metal-dependent hydrolase [Paenibacillus psychroresistens]
MEQLRYPIGRFQHQQQPTQEQLNQWIIEISEMPRVLRLVVQNLTLEQLQTPYRLGGWTIQQVVHHIEDNDMNAFIRFKRALTEDNPISGSYHENLWAELSDYLIAPIEPSLILLEALHSRFVILLNSLHASDFQKTFTSPTHGNMTLEVATHRYAWHNRHHIAQITSLIERSGW